MVREVLSSSRDAANVFCLTKQKTRSVTVDAELAHFAPIRSLRVSRGSEFPPVNLGNRSHTYTQQKVRLV